VQVEVKHSVKINHEFVVLKLVVRIYVIFGVHYKKEVYSVLLLGTVLG
jgi:hypothetical protein